MEISKEWFDAWWNATGRDVLDSPHSIRDFYDLNREWTFTLSSEEVAGTLRKRLEQRAEQEGATVDALIERAIMHYIYGKEGTINVDPDYRMLVTGYSGD